MPGIDLRPFTSADLPTAGRLLASRHTCHRQQEPLLSPRYEDPATAEDALTQIWNLDDASGSVAESGGNVIGFLLGAPKENRTTWGPNIWVEAAGHAVVEPETVRDLYGHAAGTWVQQGRTAHYVVVPSHDQAVVEAWFRVGFGQQHMHAVRAVGPTPPSTASSVTIRSARRTDIPVLALLDRALSVHQALSPVFSSAHPPSLEEAVAEWEAEIDNPAFVNFVAERDGVVIGSAIGCSIDQSSMHVGLSRPDRAGHLAFAAVLPEHRGLGAGRALGNAVLGWASQHAYPCVVTDWRVTNLLSSRTWPRLGFRDTFVRLHRVVGF